MQVYAQSWLLDTYMYFLSILECSVMNHQSWLLKTVAVELRVTSINRQRSHTQKLMKLILDDYDEDQTSGRKIVCFFFSFKQVKFDLVKA